MKATAKTDAWPLLLIVNLVVIPVVTGEFWS